MENVQDKAGLLKKLYLAACMLFFVFSILVFLDDATAAERRYGLGSVAKGTVTILREDRSIELNARSGKRDIFLGDVIRTSANTEAMIEIEDGNLMIMGGNSVLQIKPWKNGGTSGTLRSLLGKFVAKTSKILRREMNVYTTSATCGIRGSTAVIETNPGFTLVENVEGNIGMRYNNQRNFSIVPPGSSFVAVHNGNNRLFQSRQTMGRERGREASSTQSASPDDHSSAGGGNAERNESGHAQTGTLRGNEGNGSNVLLPGTEGDSFGLNQEIAPALLALGGDSITIAPAEANTIALVSSGNVQISHTEIPSSNSQEQFVPVQNIAPLPDKLTSNLMPNNSGTPSTLKNDTTQNDTTSVNTQGNTTQGTSGSTGTPVNIENIITNSQESRTEQIRERARVKIIYEK